MLTRVLCTHSCLWGWVLGWKRSKRKEKPAQQERKSSSLPLYKQQHPSRRRSLSAFSLLQKVTMLSFLTALHTLQTIFTHIIIQIELLHEQADRSVCGRCVFCKVLPPPTPSRNSQQQLTAIPTSELEKKKVLRLCRKLLKLLRS